MLVIELSWEEEKKRNKKGIKKVKKDWKRAEGAADMTPPFYPLHTFRSTCHDWSLTQAQILDIFLQSHLKLFLVLAFEHERCKIWTKVPLSMHDIFLKKIFMETFAYLL